MNTVLFVNANIGFSENLFLVKLVLVSIKLVVGRGPKNYRSVVGGGKLPNRLIVIRTNHQQRKRTFQFPKLCQASRITHNSFPIMHKVLTIRYILRGRPFGSGGGGNYVFGEKRLFNRGNGKEIVCSATY